jgi:DUF1009 family protein
MPPKLAIFAGGGTLPARLVDTCRSQGRDCTVLAFEGQTDPETVHGVPHSWARFGTVITALKQLQADGVEEIVMAGPMTRPSFTSLMPDAATANVAARILKSVAGDDSLLSALIVELENMGFRVSGVDSILKGLMSRSGQYGAHAPDDQARSDLDRGLEVARAIGGMDVGQAVVVQQGMVLGVEGVEGTDALIRRCGELKKKGPGGVLVKIKKPDQDRRADLPTVGVETVVTAIATGLRGIAFEAGVTLIIDEAEMIREADDAGLFLIGI